MLLLSLSLTFIEGWKFLDNVRVSPVKVVGASYIQSVGPEYLGGAAGNLYIYALSGIAYGNGTSRDSIFAVSLAALPRCVNDTPLVAFRQEYIVSDSIPTGRYDTTFQYVRKDSSADYGGIIVYRISYNTWQGLDTCIVKLDSAYVIPSIDDDNIPDTVYYRSSPGNLISKTGDTVYSRVEVRYKLKNTGTIQGFQIDSIVFFDRYKFRLKEYFGFLQIKLDTSRYIIYFTQFGPFPQDLVNVFTKDLTQATYAPQTLNNKFKLVGNRIIFDNPYKGYIEIYKADGTLYRRFYFNGYDLDLSRYKGLYIIRIGKDRIKFIN
jgi:hypothetical protein